MKTILNNCKFCGEEFRTHPDFPSAPSGKYCSLNCVHASKRTRVERICLTCSNVFNGSPAEIEKGHARFCSRDCWFTFKRGRRRCPDNVRCCHCNKPFRVTPHKFKSQQYFCCSYKCEDEFRKSKWQDRFWNRVDKSSDCWTWTGPVDKQGYGKATYQQRTVSAHRLSYLIHHGEFPPNGLMVCHKCDNPPCVNPNHFFIGTAFDNVADMISKGRQKTPVVPAERRARGEMSSVAKLTDEKIRQIRQMSQDGNTQQSIAAIYGICQTGISSIVRRKTWKHVE